MRRSLSIIFIGAIVIAVLIGLSAVNFIKLDRDPESEASPQRSTYNPGPTGTRALFQLLEESGSPVERFRRRYDDLPDRPANKDEEKAEDKAPETVEDKQAALLIIIGPFDRSHTPSTTERDALARWVVRGGKLLVISRDPVNEFRDPGLRVVSNTDGEDWTRSADEIADASSDRLIAQPTTFTRGLKGLQLSKLSSRIRIDRTPLPNPSPSPEHPPASAPPPVPAPSTESTVEDTDQSTVETPPPSPPGAVEETDWLSAPVVHLGDREGAALVDFDYGDGRVVFLSDPFVVANNGIARGANLTLALNLIDELAGKQGRILFDETHHGFRDSENQVLSYFRGTVAPWMLGQGVLIAMLMAYTYGRRFARPLPLPHIDRHSPLEFVGSMANLQKLASARDLALENIYPPFRARLCRKLGVPSRAERHEVAAALLRLEAGKPGSPGSLGVTASELTTLMKECEGALVGVPIDDHELVTLVRMIRRLDETLKRNRAGN